MSETFGRSGTRKRRRWLVWLLVASIVLAVCVLLFDRFERRQMIETTLEWGRLNAFPPTAANFSINTEGGMFTRSFRAHFTAPQPDIDRWLKNSPGTRDAQIETQGSIQTYHIKPGGGAAFAEVKVEVLRHLVDVHVYWS